MKKFILSLLMLAWFGISLLYLAGEMDTDNIMAFLIVKAMAFASICGCVRVGFLLEEKNLI